MFYIVAPLKFQMTADTCNGKCLYWDLTASSWPQSPPQWDSLLFCHWYPAWLPWCSPVWLRQSPSETGRVIHSHPSSDPWSSVSVFLWQIYRTLRALLSCDFASKSQIRPRHHWYPETRSLGRLCDATSVWQYTGLLNTLSRCIAIKTFTWITVMSLWFQL